MKYKYLKGSEADFDGAPDWCSAVVIFNGVRVFEEHVPPIIGISRYQDDTHDAVEETYREHTATGGMIIAHREPIKASEVSGGTYLARAIQNTAQDVSKIIDKEIKETLTTPTEALITERGSRYGKFKDGADIMQSLKDTMRDVDGWNNLTASQKEALDMIQHKIGRILNGDPTYDDSWKDIASYATLIVNELNGEIK